MNILDWKDNDIDSIIDKLLNTNLCLSDSDRFLVLTDHYKQSIGERIFRRGMNIASLAKHVSYEPTGASGIEPPAHIWKSVFGLKFFHKAVSQNMLDVILSKQLTDKDEEKVKEVLMETLDPEMLPNVVVAVNKYSITHTFFRKVCTDFLGMRFASMPLFEVWMFETSMRANWRKVASLSEKLAKLLTQADDAVVTCPLGTNITMSLAERRGFADTGIFCSPGDFGNLPAGEAFISPLEGTANGKFVTLWAPLRKLSRPTVFNVEGGKVVSIEGDEKLVSWFKNISSDDVSVSNVAELGIGTNDKAVRFDNILEAEKIYGTCHIAVGDNSSIGGYVRSSIHVDFVITSPTVRLTIAGKSVTVVENGRFTVPER